MTAINATSSDKDIIQPDILRDIVFGMAETMMVGSEVVNTKYISGIDYGFTIAEQRELDAKEISEGARAEEQTVTWFDVTGKLRKFQVPLFFTDEVSARQTDNIQIDYSLQGAAEGLAIAKDTNIMNTLSAGAGRHVTASAKWNATSADPATDLANSIGEILSNTRLPTSAIADIKLIYPMKVFGHMSKPIEIGEIQDSIDRWAKREYQLALFPTRSLTDKALAVVKSDRGAIHIQHDLSAIPGFEVYREPGVGDGYLFTQYFDTRVMPTHEGETTTNFICDISGVA